MSSLDSLRAAWRDAEHPPDGADAATRLIPALEAEVVRLQARERELEAALREIRDQEWTENVLDPQWAARIAQAALAAVSAETEDDNGK